MSKLSPRTRALIQGASTALRALSVQPRGSYTLEVVEIEGQHAEASGLMQLRWMDGPSEIEAMRALCVEAAGVTGEEGEPVLLAELLRYERRLSLGGAAALVLHRGQASTWSGEECARASLIGVGSASEHVRIMHELAPEWLKVRLPRSAEALEATALEELEHSVCVQLLGVELETAASLLAQ